MNRAERRFAEAEKQRLAGKTQKALHTYVSVIWVKTDEQLDLPDPVLYARIAEIHIALRDYPRAQRALSRAVHDFGEMSSVEDGEVISLDIERLREPLETLKAIHLATIRTDIDAKRKDPMVTDSITEELPALYIDESLKHT